MWDTVGSTYNYSYERYNKKNLLLASYIGKKIPALYGAEKRFCLWKHVKKIFQPDQTPPPLEVKSSLPYRVVLDSLKKIDLHRLKVKVTGTVHYFLKTPLRILYSMKQ